MRKNRVEITNLKKNDIIILKKKNRWLNLPSIVILIFISIFSINNNFLNDFKSDVISAFNPVNSLYSDNSDIVFTNGEVYDKFKFCLPIEDCIYEINSYGTIVFENNKISIVKSVANGIIDSIDISNDGIKTIRIRHKNKLMSVIENVDIVGVEKGQVVKSGQNIATAKNNVKIKFYFNNVQIKNIKIDQKNIIWQK